MQDQPKSAAVETFPSIAIFHSHQMLFIVPQTKKCKEKFFADFPKQNYFKASYHQYVRINKDESL